MNEYEQDLIIDPDNLDLEWLEQPILFQKYSKLEKEACRERDRAHENLKIVRSELVLKVTKDPSVADADKATGPVIEAYYRTHRRYIRAKEQYMEAEHEVQLLLVAVFAFNQRKSALENLVKLNGQDYFSSPVAPKALGDKMRERSENAGKKAANDKIKNSGNRRRNK